MGPVDDASPWSMRRYVKQFALPRTAMNLMSPWQRLLLSAWDVEHVCSSVASDRVPVAASVRRDDTDYAARSSFNGIMCVTIWGSCFQSLRPHFHDWLPDLLTLI